MTEAIDQFSLLPPSQSSPLRYKPHSKTPAISGRRPAVWLSGGVAPWAVLAVAVDGGQCIQSGVGAVSDESGQRLSVGRPATP